MTAVRTANWLPIGLVALGAAGPVFTFSGSAAAGSNAPTAEQVQKALEARRGELTTTLGRAAEIEKETASLEAEREKINSRLLETADTIKKTEGRLTEIEARIGELEAKEDMVRGSLLQRHAKIAKLLSALQRMGRNPPPVIVTRREDALKMVRSAKLLATAFPGMRSQALELVATLNELERVTSENRVESERLKAENNRLNDSRTQLAGLMETKHRTITERQTELQRVRTAAAEITKSVSDLNELITKLDRAVAQNTGLEAYNAEAKAALERAAATPAPSATTSEAQAGAASPGTGPAPVVSPAAPPTTPASPAPTEPGKSVDVAAIAPPLRGRVVELAPSSTALGTGNGRIKPAIPFELAKAKLPLPVQGRRVLTFGDRTQYGSASKGLVLETRSAAQVTSPCDGWIVYAGEFRSYGKLLILNAGGGYHVLLAGMSQIDVQPGQFVLAAEPIGTMTSAVRKEAAGESATAPVLYIEFRKDSLPIDPDPWWVDAQQKAQG